MNRTSRHHQQPSYLSNNHHHKQPSQPQSPSVMPLKFQRLVLRKNHPGEDFGFSMSDGQMEPGVYVHTVRPGGPACRAGLLRYDRILQANGQPTHDSDCTVVVPLVSGAQSQLDLFVSRNPANSGMYTNQRPLLSPPVTVNSASRRNPQPSSPMSAFT